MSGVEWADPPIRPRSSVHDWATIAAELRAHPGNWAIVLRDVNPHHAADIRNGARPAFRPPGSFEARAVGPVRDGNKKTIYARFVGEA